MFAMKNVKNMQNANLNLAWKLILKHVAREVGVLNKAFDISIIRYLVSFYPREKINLFEKFVLIILKITSRESF